MMRKKLFVVFLFLFKLSFCQNWDWARRAGNSMSWDIAECIATDQSGNILLAGRFQDSIITFGSFTLTGHGNGDVFLVKYDPNGNVLWARSTGGKKWDVARAITVDDSGNIYLGGFMYSDSITFGSTVLVNNTLNHHLFLVKYDNNGNELWAKTSPSVGYNIISGLACNSQGELFVTGYFLSNSMIDSFSLQNNGLTDVFVFKCDSYGNVLWTKCFGGSHYDYSTEVCIDVFGNIIVAGYYESTALILGVDTLNNPRPDTYTWKKNLFITKLTTSGNIIWGRGARSQNVDYEDEIALDVTTDMVGNVYIAGGFSGRKIIFDDLDTLASSGWGNILLAKYSPSGSYVWAKCSSGNSTGHASSVIVDHGNVYITGNFAGNNTCFDTLCINSNGGYNCFLITYSSNGKVLWGTSVGSNGNDYVSSHIAKDSTGNIYLIGGFQGPDLTIGSNYLINSDTSSNTVDVFIAKLSNSQIVTEINSNGDREFTSVIYPNPCKDILNIDFSMVEKNINLKLINSIGQTIINREVYAAKGLTLNISGITKGIYFLSISIEEKKYQKKIIIQ